MVAVAVVAVVAVVLLLELPMTTSTAELQNWSSACFAVGTSDCAAFTSHGLGVAPGFDPGNPPQMSEHEPF